MDILGPVAFGQNPAACLLQSGRLMAFAEEERFTRLKGSNGMFPRKAALYCLSAAKLDLAAVDCIAFGWDASKYPWAMLRHLAKSYLKYKGRERRAARKLKESPNSFQALKMLLDYHPARGPPPQGFVGHPISG